MRKILLLWGLLCAVRAAAQPTFPLNGVADERDITYAFTHATVMRDGKTPLQDATLLVRKGRITAVGSQITIPADAVVMDCKGKYIYPSFIDLYADYGISGTQRSMGGFNWNAPPQLNSNQKGAFGWNQAIRTDVEAARMFNVDESRARSLREIGFGTVLTHHKDGIARGSGVLVTLADQK